VLPYSSDEQLLADLAVVVSVGWDLPSRANRAHQVRHLLLLADPGEALLYRQAAQRLLAMLDAALQQDADEHPVVNEEDSLGLRILFGVHTNYRTESSPVVRREQASEYLVPAWRDRPPHDRAGTFQRRHQQRALRQALNCLRAAYGQEPRPTIRDSDLIEERRWYYVAANRQVVRFRCEDIIRPRVDGLESHVFYEPRNDDEGILNTRFRIVEHPIGPPLNLEEISDAPTQPGHRQIVLRFPRPYMAGELVGIAWEEELDFGPNAERWRRFFVGAHSPNDGFDLELTVTFADDAELPEMVWRYIALPDVADFELGPRPEEILSLDASRSVSYRWIGAETERWINYCLQWVWPN
jgi:hypothetical protein